jgi:hypothetical protein
VNLELGVLPFASTVNEMDSSDVQTRAFGTFSCLLIVFLTVGNPKFGCGTRGREIKRDSSV